MAATPRVVPPRWIVLDLMLPDLDGFALYQVGNLRGDCSTWIVTRAGR